MRRILIDTGPLVAILSRNDEHHESCVAFLKEVSGPLVCCWPVITEAVWLLRAYPDAVQQLLRSLGTGFLELLPLTENDAAPIADILKKYQDLRPQLADAALVHLADREKLETIFTLDQQDFSVYRSSRRRPFRIVPGTSPNA